MDGEPFWSAPSPSPLQPSPHSCCCNPAAHSLLWQRGDTHSEICSNPSIRNQQPGSGAPCEETESLRWQSSRTAGALNTARSVCSTSACNDLCQFLPDTINAIDYFTNMACYKKNHVLVARGYRWSAGHLPFFLARTTYWKIYLTSTKLFKKSCLKYIYLRNIQYLQSMFHFQGAPHPLCVDTCGGLIYCTSILFLRHRSATHSFGIIWIFDITLTASFQILNISNKYFKCRILIKPFLPQIIMHYIIYWTSVRMLISLHSLHIVLDNPSNILLLSFDYCSFNF